MPGILGLISKQNNKKLFIQMMNKINHYNYNQESYCIDDAYLGIVHLNYLNENSKNYFSRNDRYIIFMIGEIFSYNGTNINPSELYSTFLLDKFVTKGFDSFSKINGQYSACIYDIQNNQLFLISDRFGTRPLYYTTYKENFLFSPEVKSLLLLNQNRKIDENAISDLFHFSHLFGYKTMFQNISQLPPASVLQYKDNKIQITKYWDYPYDEDAYELKKPSKELIEKYQEEMKFLMTQAVRRQTIKNKSSILVSLSGGLDSRWVISLAHHFKIHPITAFTMGEHNSEDVIYAQLVADHIQADHQYFPIRSENIWDDAKTFSFISDAMSMIYGPIAGFNPLRHYYKKKEIIISSQMCDAIFGSTLSHKKIKALSKKTKWDTETNKIFSGLFNLFREEDLKLVFNKSYYEQLKDGYKENYSFYINNSIHPMYAYYKILMNEHGRRGTLCGNIMNNLFFETRMPSYDNDLMDFAFRLPLSLKKNQYIYRRAFNRIFPQLAAIPREGTNLPLTASDYRIQLKKLELRIVKKLKSTSLNSAVQKFSRWNKPAYVNFKRWMKVELKDKVENFLFDERTLQHGIFNPDGIRTILKYHYSTETDYSRLIWQMINLEYFYRHFID